MSRNLPFFFQEVLGVKELARLPDALHVKGEGDPEVLLIIRFLSGALSIEHKLTEKVINQRVNYLAVDYASVRSSWGRAIVEKIGEEVEVSDFAGYISQVKHRNRAFFKNVLLELCNFALHTERGSHTSAFIYIYRALEKIAYAFPLIYVSLADDFTRTFNELKTLFIGDGKELDKKGELNFYKTFVEMFYKDDPIGESSIDFPIAIGNERIQESFFNSLYELTQGNMQGGATARPTLISIKFCEVGSFIITVRNRFFHNMNGGPRNLDSQNIVDSDAFFQLLNRQCVAWLATIFVDIVGHHMSEIHREG